MMPDRASDPFGWAGCVLNGHFAVDAPTREGGFGIVYRGRHLGLDVPIAIKYLKVSEHLGEGERASFLQRLVGEARLLHKLSCKSPYVVQSLHVDAAVSPSGTWMPYMVMEWLSGDTLEDRLARTSAAMDIGEAIALLSSVASALSVAHEENIAHLDLKPSNMIFAPFRLEPKLKVLDFGVAKVFADSPRLTISNADARSAVRYFTPQYAAPEQFSPDYGPVGPWTDVFALALLLVELASGRRVLEGDSILHLYVAAIDESKRDRVLERVQGAGEHVRDVLRRALDVNPRLRYRSIGAMWSAILEAQALDQEGPITQPTGVVGLGESREIEPRPLQEELASVALIAPEPKIAPKGMRTRVGGALALGAMAAALGAFVWLGPRPEPLGPGPILPQNVGPGPESQEEESPPTAPGKPQILISNAPESGKLSLVEISPAAPKAEGGDQRRGGGGARSMARKHAGLQERKVRPIDDLPEELQTPPKEARTPSPETAAPPQAQAPEPPKPVRPKITDGWGID